MKLKYNILAIVAAIAFSGCSSSKKVGEAVDLNGEWNIVEVGGTAIDTTKTEFETAKNSVFGCAGCNSINGIARVNAAKQTISFKEIGTTLMLCAHMEYEQQILKALESVKAYKSAGEGRVQLTNGSGKAMLTLQKQ